MSQMIIDLSTDQQQLLTGGQNPNTLKNLTVLGDGYPNGSSPFGNLAANNGEGNVKELNYGNNTGVGFY